MVDWATVTLTSTLLPSLRSRIGPAREGGLSAGTWRCTCVPQKSHSDGVALHLRVSHPWGRTLGQPVRQASALAHEEARASVSCDSKREGKKERKKERATVTPNWKGRANGEVGETAGWVDKRRATTTNTGSIVLGKLTYYAAVPWKAALRITPCPTVCVRPSVRPSVPCLPLARKQKTIQRWYLEKLPSSRITVARSVANFQAKQAKRK